MAGAKAGGNRGGVVFQTDFETPWEREAWWRGEFARWEPGYEGTTSLRVELPTSSAEGSGMIHLPLDLTPYRGARLLFRCMAIDLLVRRSSDHGRTWQAVQLLHEEGGVQPVTIGNPCPIAAADGTIHLLFCRNNRQAFYTRTTDDGRSFSPPRGTTEALRPFSFSFARLGTGPVHGIQNSSGRLLAPLWLNNKIGQDYRSGVAYSDDGGNTWNAGGLVPAEVKGLNECTAAELPGGKLLLNMRNRQARCRAVSASDDGGLSWSRPQLAEELVDPQCQGGSAASAG